MNKKQFLKQARTAWHFNDQVLLDSAMNITPIKKLPLITKILIGVICWCEHYGASFNVELKIARKFYKKIYKL